MSVYRCGDKKKKKCWGSKGGEDGWSAVGRKRGKPRRNKRPSGLIRRQIGCRAQWQERERKREREGERYRGAERE